MGDFNVTFEPDVSRLEKEKKGFAVRAIGKLVKRYLPHTMQDLMVAGGTLRAQDRVSYDNIVAPAFAAEADAEVKQ